MTFDRVFPYLNQGKIIKRKTQNEKFYLNKHSVNYFISINDLLADDWVVMALNFTQAINALIDGKKIAHIYDLGEKEKYLCLRDNKLYKGLGCCGVKEYRFTKEDVCAEDWVIIE